MKGQKNKQYRPSLFTERECTQSNPSHNNPSYLQSPYITKGVFSQVIQYDPSITLLTLDLVKLSGNSVILGRGALSTVYLAKHRSSNTNYAIKEMKKKLLIETLGSLEPILNEIDIHSRLIHKNIIKVYNVHEDNDSIKIILEHASNGSLYSFIKRRRGLNEKKAFEFFIQAASAIQFLHANDIIHRDLKPENFVIGDNDELKLCDFGWSNRILNSTRDTICGTVEYMAPEIIKREQYDKAIDIWSLGVLLYELLHEHSPFNNNPDDEANPRNIISKIKDKSFRIEKELSDECKDIIARMLEKDPKKRITIEEVFTHPFVKYYESLLIKNQTHRKHVSVCSDVPIIRRQLTTNEAVSAFKAKLNKLKGDSPNKMKEIADLLLSETIDTEGSLSNKQKKDDEKGTDNANTPIKPKNKLSFKMAMNKCINLSSRMSMNSNNYSDGSSETTITPIKTMSVKQTNVWFSQLKKPKGRTPSVDGK